MKKILPFLFSLFLISAFAQDSVDAMVVPRETSFENYNLLVIALVGLALLIAIYFIWRRRKKR